MLKIINFYYINVFLNFFYYIYTRCENWSEKKINTLTCNLIVIRLRKGYNMLILTIYLWNVETVLIIL